MQDSQVLQSDLESLQHWERTWDMEFNPGKGQVFHITRSKSPVKSRYFMHTGTRICGCSEVTGRVQQLTCVTDFLMDEGLLSFISAYCGQLVKMFITLELHGIFRSNCAYLFILTLSSHWYAKWR